MTDAGYIGSIAQLRAQQQAKTEELWPIFLTANWRNLVMLTYEVEPDILFPRVPAGTELDLFRGRALVSVVGFQFLDTRVLGLPIPMHRSFPEVNLRFYVRRSAGGELRRGVAFIKEIVPRRAIAYVARTLYHENYIRLPMRERIVAAADDASQCLSLEYGWRLRQQWNRLQAATSKALAPPAAGSLQQFIAEHHWGYATQPDGGCLEYRVQHPRWQVAEADDSVLECDVETLYGGEFVEPLRRTPCSALLVDGSSVTVSRGRRLAAPRVFRRQG